MHLHSALSRCVHCLFAYEDLFICIDQEVDQRVHTMFDMVFMFMMMVGGICNVVQCPW
jgi:hypothetical protein